MLADHLDKFRDIVKIFEGGYSILLSIFLLIGLVVIYFRAFVQKEMEFDEAELLMVFVKLIFLVVFVEAATKIAELAKGLDNFIFNAALTKQEIQRYIDAMFEKNIGSSVANPASGVKMKYFLKSIFTDDKTYFLIKDGVIRTVISYLQVIWGGFLFVLGPIAIIVSFVAGNRLLGRWLAAFVAVNMWSVTITVIDIVRFKLAQGDSTSFLWGLAFGIMYALVPLATSMYVPGTPANTFMQKVVGITGIGASVIAMGRRVVLKK